MTKPTEHAVAAAIESYSYAPRALSVSKVVKQLIAVFPDQDHATLTEQVQRSRREFRLRAAQQDHLLQGYANQ